jgi:uncharacterized protein involved in exopolysaccharide biosynthesis
MSTNTEGATVKKVPGVKDMKWLETLVVLGQNKAILLFITVFGVVCGAASAFLITPVYTAITVLVPPQQQQSSAVSSLAALGAISGLAGGGLGLKSPDEMYIAFLGSERLQKALINRFHLMERYDENYLVDARKNLDKRTKLATNKKTGLITIEVDDIDPVVASEIANAYVQELYRMLSTLAVSEAQQRRLFFEQQVVKAKNELSKAEISFKQLQQTNGMQLTQALAETGVRASVELRVQIASREVQMQALRGTYATAQNPEVTRLASEIAALRDQLKRQEQGSPSREGTSKPLEGQDAAVRAYRDVKVQETLLEQLIRQTEFARVDEAKEGPLLQQVDVAVPPERKSKPKRALIVLGSLFGSLALGVLYVLFKNWKQRVAQSEVNAPRLEALRAAWRFRSN